MNATNNSYEEFLIANLPNHVKGFDYVRSIYKALKIPADFIFWFSRLFCPNLIQIGASFFVEDLFDEAIYKSLQTAGHNDASIQYWMNLLEITGLFDELSEQQTLEVAKNIAASWNKKLEDSGCLLTAQAHAFHDKGTGEIFVTIGHHAHNSKRSSDEQIDTAALPQTPRQT